MLGDVNKVLALSSLLSTILGCVHFLSLAFYLMVAGWLLSVQRMHLHLPASKDRKQDGWGSENRPSLYSWKEKPLLDSPFIAHGPEHIT